MSPLNYKKSSLLAFILVTGMSACTVAPKYEAGISDVPNNWPDSVKAVRNHKVSSYKNWWESFNDPVLNKIIKKAQKKNFDIMAAVNIIEQSYNNLDSRKMDILPRIGAQAVGRTSESQNASVNNVFGSSLLNSSPLSSNSSNSFAGFNLDWEIDLFGKLKYKKDVANAILKENIIQTEGVRLSVISAIIKTYVTYRKNQKKILILEDIVRDDRSVLKLLKSRYESGLDDYSISTNHEISLNKSEAEIETLKADVFSDMRYLELLSGARMGAFTALLKTAKPIPYSRETVELNTPAAVIVHRPDVAEAEQKMVEAQANVGVAKTSLMPSFNLTGLLGWQNVSLFNYIDSSGGFKQSAISMMFPFLDMRLHKDLKGKKIAYMKSAIDYQKSVHTALSEISSYYSAYKHQKNSTRRIKRALEIQQSNYQIHKKEYDNSTKNYINLIDAKNALHSLEFYYLNTQETYAISTVNLYKSLGAGCIS